MADFRTFDPCNLLAPVPAVMVSCRAPEADAKPNIVTVAWVGTVNSEPPMMSISNKLSFRELTPLVRSFLNFIQFLKFLIMQRIVFSD